jgi:hypothetical protein
VNTFDRWRRRSGGMGVPELRRQRHLEQENARLKRLLAERDLEVDALRELLAKNMTSSRIIAPTARRCASSRWSMNSRGSAWRSRSADRSAPGGSSPSWSGRSPSRGNRNGSARTTGRNSSPRC